MKFIRKKPEPQFFRSWKKQGLPTLVRLCKGRKPGNSLWDALPSSLPENPEPGIHYYSKEQLREELLNEQGFLCCYCNRLFYEGGQVKESLQAEPPTEIEHIVPRSIRHKRTLDYSNLAASCHGGRKLKPAKQSCNARRGNNFLPVTPHNPDCETRIQFSMDGSAFGKNEDLDAQRTIELLNLNKFQKERGDFMSGFIYENPQTKEFISKKDARKILEDLAERDTQNAYRPFCSAVINVIKQEILMENE